MARVFPFPPHGSLQACFLFMAHGPHVETNAGVTDMQVEREHSMVWHAMAASDADAESVQHKHNPLGATQYTWKIVPNILPPTAFPPAVQCSGIHKSTVRESDLLATNHHHISLHASRNSSTTPRRPKRAVVCDHPAAETNASRRIILSFSWPRNNPAESIESRITQPTPNEQTFRSNLKRRHASFTRRLEC